MKSLPKASICSGKTCLTVEGEAAKILNGIVLAIAITTLITVVAKALA